MNKRVKELEKGINNKEVFRKIQIVANRLKDSFDYDYIDKNATIDSFYYYCQGLYEFDIIDAKMFNDLTYTFNEEIYKSMRIKEETKLYE